MPRWGTHSSSLSAAGWLSCASARSLPGLGLLVWVSKNLVSSGSALQRPSGTGLFVYEPAEHGFALTAAPTGSVRLEGSDTAKGGL